MDKLERKDLAEDYFIHSWPAWIRWILFVPAGLLASLIVPIIVNSFSGQDVNSHSLTAGWFRLVSSILFGVVLVAVSSTVAPKSQFEVAVIMLVILSIITAAIWVKTYDLSVYSQSKDLLWFTAHSVAQLIGGISALLWVKEELK